MAAASERPRAGQKLIQDHAAGEQIRAPVSRQPLVLFWRHVSGSADFGADLRQHGRFDLGHAKVSNFDAPVVGNHDVGRLDIAMHHLAAVGMVERIKDFSHDANDFFEVKFVTLIEIGLQLFAADVLHRDKGDVVSLAIVVNGAHARVVEPAGRLCLLLEPVEQTLRLGGVERVLQNGLDRNPASDNRVNCIVDGTHRPCTEDANYIVLAKIFRKDHIQTKIARVSGSTTSRSAIVACNSMPTF